MGNYSYQPPCSLASSKKESVHGLQATSVGQLKQAITHASNFNTIYFLGEGVKKAAFHQQQTLVREKHRGKDSEERTARKGQRGKVGKDSEGRTTRKGQRGKDNEERTARKGPRGKDSEERTARKGQRGKGGVAKGRSEPYIRS